MNKTLVTYFSATGITKKAAEKIANIINADLFEIEPIDIYTKEDLDYKNENSRTTIEMNDRKFRPPIKNKVENINDYNTILIGFPVWWYTAPTIINTFIEENNLNNKNIYIFVTSGSSSFDSSLNNLKKEYSNLKIIDGIRITDNENEEDIKKWLKIN